MEDKTKNWLPENFKIPELFEDDFIKLEFLTSKDADADYALIMEPENRKHIQGCLTGYDDTWPTENFTYEQDFNELVEHEVYMKKNRGFSYKIIDKENNKYIGCFYILPTNKKDFNAKTYMWVDKKSFDEGKDGLIFNKLKLWVSDKWPFSQVGYPGRDISFEDWKNII